MLCHVSSICLNFSCNFVTFGNLVKKKILKLILQVLLFWYIRCQMVGIGSKAGVKSMQMI